MDGIKREYRGQSNVVYVDLDRARGKETAREYGVMGTPTLLFLDSEGNSVHMLRGSLSQAAVERVVEDLLSQNG